MPGIRLDAASYAVTGREILSNLSFTLTERRIAVIGRNGSGKTTLLRLMAGLIAPSSGTVQVEGMDPARDRKAMLDRLGILFQNPDHQIIFPTVGEELAFGLKQQGRTSDEAAGLVSDLLARHGRTHWEKAPVQTLSHGQRHFLCLLAILAMQPATILLDEPFAGFDMPTIARMSRMFDALPQRLIAITHAPHTAANADRVLWLEAGRIRADGRPGDVLPQFEAEMARMGAVDADTDLAL
ncbi:ABC transporter ATP-binding protein [Rhizobium sp. KVB221]|uniref:ABC transporter ATP-binding protein n=1 Tax=Rhizobium setariae TaxID=2801340 RepID=A0A936YQ86_9HYPH|nr:ABC transporter ATP-binding protein [Rhizobium setariae]MBL0374725.1 ABC transporter ATP-binding protein [Rhizobium setariae]